jgi:ribosome-binding factor A
MINFGSKRVSEIKKAQKEKLLFKEISKLFLELTLDNPELRDLFVSRVILSPDKSNCFIYFYSPHGQNFFEEKLQLLKLYKPSMRKSISSIIEARYTPELIFKYDEQHEKTEKINQLLEKIKTEDRD